MSATEAPPRVVPHRATALDFKTMDTPTLEAAVLQLEYDLIFISEQLAEDWQEGSLRGEKWRKSAGLARAHVVASLKITRGMLAERLKPKPKLQADIQAEAKAQKAAKKAEKAEAHAALMRQNQEHVAQMQQKKQARVAAAVEHQAGYERRQTRRARMFQAAAKKCLTGDQIMEVWRRAEEMFPNDPVWLPYPSMKDILA